MTPAIVFIAVKSPNWPGMRAYLLSPRDAASSREEIPGVTPPAPNPVARPFSEFCLPMTHSFFRRAFVARSSRQSQAGARNASKHQPAIGRMVERLEARQLMSTTVAAADPAVLAADGYEPIAWNGQQAYAKPGQFVLKVGDVNGKPADQLAKVNAKIKNLGPDGKDVRATKQLGDDGLVLVQTPKELTHGKAKEKLQKLPGFKLLEPDFALWAQATANDTYYASHQWALNNTGQLGGTIGADIDAPAAWDVTRGSKSVVVGVIDSGVDYAHPDLAANVWTNPGEAAGDGLDNDGNGYVDDVRGWDFYNNDNNPADDNGHGTHVAGSIAATPNNGTGVAGVADASVLPLKFLGADGSGSSSAALAAVNYATKLRRDHGVNVRVTNNSWGGGGFSQAMSDAIRAHGEAGILFVAAAGNGGADGVGDNTDLAPEYPAAYNQPNVLSVAATDAADQLASFSNFGTTTVHLAAPGVSIASTWTGGGYSYSNGTSMAAPHVSGAAALAFAYSPAAGVGQVRSALLNGVDKVSTLAGKVATDGRLNAAATLRLLAPPAAPSGLTASAASGTEVRLAWADGSTNEDGFRVERSIDGGATFAQVAVLGANATAFADTGLSAGRSYAYRIRAYNANGASGYTNVATATTPAAVVTLPAAPTGLAARAVSSRQINLTWADASTNESGFRIERSLDGRAWTQVGTVGANATAFAATSLSKRTTYYFRVAAYNTAGSAYSAVASARTF